MTFLLTLSMNAFAVTEDIDPMEQEIIREVEQLQKNEEAKAQKLELSKQMVKSLENESDAIISN